MAVKSNGRETSSVREAETNAPGARMREHAENGGMNLGVRIRHARLTLGLRLQDVAGQVGCSESLLSKIENDRALPSLTMLHRIAGALQTTVGKLCTTDDLADSVVARAGERQVVTMDPLRKATSTRLERLIP